MLNHEEMVSMLKTAKFRWMLTEYRQPLYVEAFGDPFAEIKVQKVMHKILNSSGGKPPQGRRVHLAEKSFSV
jgi:hypothetical protein